jgi:hypothetical protein
VEALPLGYERVGLSMTQRYDNARQPRIQVVNRTSASGRFQTRRLKPCRPDLRAREVDRPLNSVAQRVNQQRKGR